MRALRLLLPVLVTAGIAVGCRAEFDVEVFSLGAPRVVAATGVPEGVRVQWRPADAASYAVYLSSSGEAGPESFNRRELTAGTSLVFSVTTPVSIAITSVRADATETEATPAVHASSITFFSTAPAGSIDGSGGGDYSLGSAVAAADVNGDGFDDVIAGGPFTSGNNGRVYLKYGAGAGLSTQMAVVYSNPQSNANLGASISTGDLDGDAYADVLVGAIRYSGSFPQEGGVALFSGSPGGLVADDTPDYLVGQSNGRGGTAVLAYPLDGTGFDDVLVGAPGYNGFFGALMYWNAGSGQAPVARVGQDALGQSICAADVAGDATIEVLVGHPGAGAGRVEIFTGSALVPSTPLTAPASLTGKANFGRAVVRLPSFLGDERDEIVIGASSATNGGMSGAGWTGLYQGAADAPFIDDGWSAGGDEIDEHLGSALASADVDNDGFPELLVGAPGHHRAGAGLAGPAGRVLLFRGSASGLTGPAWEAEGPVNGIQLGASVAFGDVNGDGFSDAVAGAPEGFGAVRVWLAHPIGPMPSITLPAGRIEAGESVEVVSHVDDPVAGRAWSCVWNFGDGTPSVAAACGEATAHVYDAPGLFDVRLYVAATGNGFSGSEAAAKLHVE